MTDEQASGLKPGDNVFGVVCFIGTPTKIHDLRVKKVVHSTESFLGSNVLVTTSDGNSYPATRVSHTATDARECVQGILKKRIEKTQKELKEWS